MQAKLLKAGDRVKYITNCQTNEMAEAIVARVDQYQYQVDLWIGEAGYQKAKGFDESWIVELVSPTPVQTSTVYVVTGSNEFRIWWNRQGCYWQTDIRSLRDVDDFHYFRQAHSLFLAMTNVAITL
jgi:hypothetical protein